LQLDRTMLEAFRRGEPEVLTLLYHQHVAEIELLARAGFSFDSKGSSVTFRGYPHLHAQQNLVQETFVRAFSPAARASYDGISPYGAYLRTIAKNIVIDGYRGRAAEQDSPVPGRLFEETTSAIVDPGPNPEERLRRDGVIRAVRDFVEKLPDRERKLVALRFEEGLGQEEVAKKMRVGRSTVRTLERRVRGRLHKALRAIGISRPSATTRVGVDQVEAAP
jgi:RNA polymerase sigma-70 factor, ECF subfamily